jgi:hypothetical protein
MRCSRPTYAVLTRFPPPYRAAPQLVLSWLNNGFHDVLAPPELAARRELIRTLAAPVPCPSGLSGAREDDELLGRAGYRDIASTVPLTPTPEVSFRTVSGSTRTTRSNSRPMQFSGVSDCATSP